MALSASPTDLSVLPIVHSRMCTHFSFLLQIPGVPTSKEGHPGRTVSGVGNHEGGEHLVKISTSLPRLRCSQAHLVDALALMAQGLLATHTEWLPVCPSVRVC